MQRPVSAVERQAPSKPPRVSTVAPTVAAPNSVLTVSGYALGLEDRGSVQVFFRQGNQERTARIGSAGRALSADPDNEYQYMDVVVPADLAQGRWALVINANGRSSTPVSVEIRDEVEMQLTSISPPTPHPSQIVLLKMKAPAQNGDQVQLTDARGQQWHVRAGLSALGISVWFPDEVADGEASIRIARNVNGAERLSAPLRFFITSGPLPLKADAVAAMTPVSPGQWTDLAKDVDIEFEVKHADRIDVEFKQGSVVEISRTTGPENLHVQVPARLKPGDVSVRTRTWIEQTVSEWSAATTFTVLQHPVPPTITAIIGTSGNMLWWWRDPSPAVVQTRAGEALFLRGHFPVASVAALHVALRGPRILELPVRDVDGDLRVEIPSQAAAGEWRLVVGTKDGRTLPQEITTIRVN